MKVLQINAIANSGSTGRIGEELGKELMSEGIESYFAYGRYGRESASKLIKIGTQWNIMLHVFKSRLFDRHGFGSSNATQDFIYAIDEIQPDLIHLHNIHGYYINIKILFNYLKKINKPLVWTLHDCWAFTGHCSHFEFVDCYKWKTHCNHCPNIHAYPKSWYVDNSFQNFDLKKKLFTGFSKMTLVSPSVWLSNHLRDSFLGNYDVKTIHNGIDIQQFKPYNPAYARQKFKLPEKQFVLGVSSVWTVRKGLNDFLTLRSMLHSDIEIVLLGLNENQLKNLPEGITGISRTDNVSDLAAIYSAAAVFVNPTYVDNFPTTNIEALACGTPVISYNTGGSAESIDQLTGIVIEKGNIQELHSAIIKVLNSPESYEPIHCRNRAISLFSSGARYKDYLNLYKEQLNVN